MALIALVLFIGIVVAVLLGYPVAICLGGLSLVVGYIFLGPAFMQFLPSRILGVLSNYVLLAVPMFILMGLALQRSGLAEALLQSMSRIAGKKPGGLAFAVLFVGTLLAASTGIVGASVVTLGLIALPAMRAAGYSPQVASGLVASVGSLGQIVPPSIVLILLGSVMQVSVGELFRAAVLPSVLIVGGYAVYLLLVAWLKPAAMPAHQVLISSTPVEPATSLWLAILGPLLLIGGVLGSILAGIASPTEASGVGATMALVLLYLSGRWSRKTVLEVAIQSVRLTAMVFFILLGATTFALVFRGLEGDVFLVEAVSSSGLSAKEFVASLLVVVFIAGFFIDFIEIIFIVVPVALPIVVALGVDPVWLALLLGVNLQTSFLTPPFGFSLFYLRGVAPPEISTQEIYRGVIPFVVIQVLVLLFLFFSF